MIEVVTFAGPLTDTGEHRVAAEHLGDVVDQLLDQNRLAHAGAAEQADLAALGVGAQQVDDLDARRQDFSFGGLFVEGRSRTVDRRARSVLDRAVLVDRVTGHVHDAAERARADRNRDRAAHVGNHGAALQAFGRVHRDRANRVLAEVLGHFEHELLTVVFGLERVLDIRQLAIEFHVDDSARDLDDAALAL